MVSKKTLHIFKTWQITVTILYLPFFLRRKSLRTRRAMKIKIFSMRENFLMDIFHQIENIKLEKFMQDSSSKVKKKHSKKWWWISLLCIVLLAGGGAIYTFLFNDGEIPFLAQKESYTTYQTASILQRDVRVSINGSGTLITTNAYDLNFSSQGVVEELNVQLGDKVKAGDVLAKQGNSITLEANIASSELNVLEAKKTLDDLLTNADVNLSQ